MRRNYYRNSWKGTLQIWRVSLLRMKFISSRDKEKGTLNHQDCKEYQRTRHPLNEIATVPTGSSVVYGGRILVQFQLIL